MTKILSILFLLVAILTLSGCATKGGTAVFGWKSNITIANEGDANAEAYIEAATEGSASLTP